MDSPLLFDSLVFVQSPLGMRMQGLSELYNDPATFDMACHQPLMLHVAHPGSTSSTDPFSSPSASPRFESPPIAPEPVQLDLIPSMPFSPSFSLSNPLQFVFPPPSEEPGAKPKRPVSEYERPSDFILRGFHDGNDARILRNGKRRRSDDPPTEEPTANENDGIDTQTHAPVVEDLLDFNEIHETRAFFPCSSRGAQLQSTTTGLPVFMLRNDRVDNQFRPCYIHFTYLSATLGVPNLRIWLTIHGIAYEMAWTIITGKFKPRVRISVTHLLRERPNILCARRMPVRATVEFKRGDITVTSRQCVLECAFRNRISVGI